MECWDVGLSCKKTCESGRAVGIYSSVSTPSVSSFSAPVGVNFVLRFRESRDVNEI